MLNEVPASSTHKMEVIVVKNEQNGMNKRPLELGEDIGMQDKPLAEANTMNCLTPE